MDHRHQIVWTSPNTWPTPVKIALGTTAAVGSGFALFYLLKKKNEHAVDASPTTEEIEYAAKTPEEKAQLLKVKGNKFFQSRNYGKAAEIFKQAVDLLIGAEESEEKTQTLSILYNNYSACMEFQNEMNSALEYTTKAIELNPDYVKPYVRRSRIYKLKKDYRAAISDLAKLFIVHANTKDSEKYLSDLADVSNTILTDNVEKVYKARIDSEQYLPISQATTMEWMHQTVAHDPLLNLMHSLGEETPDKTLDLALYHLKRHEYDQVLPFAINALVDKFLGDRGRFLATLLAARMYEFAGLKKQVQFVFEALQSIWDNTSEEFKSNNADLLMALFVFKISIESPEAVESELKQNFELCIGNADPFIVLFMNYYNVVKAEKASEMLDLARKVEPNHPYIEFHEMSSKFLKASQNQDMLGLHNLTAEMDRRFRGNTNVPEFAVLTAARIFHTVQNTPLAIELLKKYAEAHKDRTIIFDYLYLVLSRELDTDRANATQNLIRDLNGLALRDVYNFEINRMLFRCQLTNDHNKAADAAEKELLNARGMEEFTAAYHDVILGSALSERSIPMGDQLLDYRGPEYIRANSEENSIKFVNSPIGAP